MGDDEEWAIPLEPAASGMGLKRVITEIRERAEREGVDLEAWKAAYAEVKRRTQTFPRG